MFLLILVKAKIIITTAFHFSIEKFFNRFRKCEDLQISRIGGGKNKPSYKIDISTIQSLNRNGLIKSELHQYGQIIVDECHHISAVSFEKVLKAVRAKKVYGLTATPVRKDGLHPIIFMQCGPIRYKTNSKQQANIRPFKQTLVRREKLMRTNETD
ncbi:DEAD/DEAH box helicase family protein [Aquibacillus sp. 3ASR75-11]|uniref:DEAD/DEAH box helicase family protein n=1 Tax=Terrihalobacillus insolitus TaxID=2950438 RepID=A0A9X4AP43_9BACI|nr:DEAD/DEAH box helicase family protein [Terrihalobacillus insolitus]MDC3413185.1 DEAD/DEAH box helicase family protein [Terrihalobacillus insolitus]MDC3425155.1 DEAD/DEAH box helicase family protein [Terrihalobacillus insolitus]